MPSHIYATLGMWHEVIRSDLASDEMVRNYTARVNPAAAADQGRNAGRYHSLDFLIHAHLQLAQDDKAKTILDVRNGFGDAEFPANVRYSMHTAYAAIPVRHAFERGAWGEAAALPIARTIYPQAEAISWFGRALGAARSGDARAARQAVEQLRALEGKLAQANDDYWAGQVDIQETAAMAWIALREGRRDEASTLMRRAADLEDGSGKHVAMENRLSPMRELLGELLLDANEPARALEALEASLRNNPNRYRSYAGAARAAEMAGDRALARTYSEKLLALVGSSGSERPDLIVARRRLADN
jgi:predicted Zn-dependent protease